MEKLTTLASSQPHAAYAAIAHGLSGKWAKPARTVLGTINLLNDQMSLFVVNADCCKLRYSQYLFQGSRSPLTYSPFTRVL